MALPKLPDWAIYGAVVAVLVLAAQTGRERADAPPAPDQPQGVEGDLIGPPPGFEHTVAVEPVAGPGAPLVGAAFAVSASGRWITAESVVKGCRKAAILVGGGQALEARVAPQADGLTALLIADVAPTALPLAPVALASGERGFHVGYPQAKAGEFTTRLIGRRTLRLPGRGEGRRTVLAWAMVGRTSDLHGPLTGMAGAPVLDGEGRVVGVTLGEARRRGLVLTTTPESLAAAVTGPIAHEPAVGQPITTENYGRAADTLRRDLRVAQVRCL